MSLVFHRTVATLLAIACSSVAQKARGQIPEQRLSDPVSSFSQAFGMVGGLIELPDGRVMVADPLGQVLLVLDMATGTADTLGRVGQGPAEYRQPDGLFPLPGDSILLVDLGNGRLTVLHPDLAFGGTTPISQGSPMSGAMTIRMPQAVDSQGRIYFQQMMGRMRPGGEMAESASVLRWDRASGEIDTVAMVKLEEMQVRRSGGANARSVSMSPVPMSPRDGWAVAWDGGVALVRSADYHVEWIEENGSARSGPPVEYQPVRIRQPDKEEWVDAMAASGLSVGVENINGQITTSFRRGGGRETRQQIDSYDWPDVMPAFKANRIRVAPDGTLWVERYVSAGSAATFDVFDRTGRLSKQVILPAGRRIAGFGEGVLYAVFGDEYDLQWLEAYRLQTAGR